MAFDTGYEAGDEDAPSGERLAEAEAPQYAFYDPSLNSTRNLTLPIHNTALFGSWPDGRFVRTPSTIIAPLPPEPRS